MKPVLIYLRPLNQKTGTRIDVRVADGPSADTYGVGAVPWLPAVLTRPKMSIELMSPDMDGKVQAGNATFELALGQIFTRAAADDIYWKGAAVVIHNTGALEGPTAVADFWGYVTQARIDFDTGKLSITAEVSTALIDKPLLVKEFSGGGGIDGDADKRGVYLPVGMGIVKNIQPVWFDLTRNIGMIDGYNNTQSINWLGEGLSSFGDPVANYANYAALAAAIDAKAIPPGRWGMVAKPNQPGLVGLGAPPVGVITVHATFAYNRIGAMMRRILTVHAELPMDRLDFGAFDALDAQVPFPAHFWTTEQRQVKDLLEALAQSCNATPLVTFQNRVTVTRAVANAFPVTTLDRSGQIEPRVLDWQYADVNPPYYRLRGRAARPAFVLTTDQVNYKDVIEDKGLYKAADTYRAGQIVWLADGSQWLYQNDTPAAGHNPPSNALPDFNGNVQDAWWFRLQPPKTASDFTYNDGTPIEALKPGQAGADVTGTNTASGIVGQGPGATAPGSLIFNNLITLLNNGTLLGAGGGGVTFGGLGGGALGLLSSLGFGSPLLTGFGLLAPKNTVQFGGGPPAPGVDYAPIFSQLGAYASDAGYQTVLGTAAAFLGQGGLATRNSADYADGTLTNIPFPILPAQILQGTYLQAPLIKYGTDQTVEALKPGEPNANVTETRTAAALFGQGLLATRSIVGPSLQTAQARGNIIPDGSMLDSAWWGGSYPNIFCEQSNEDWPLGQGWVHFTPGTFDQFTNFFDVEPGVTYKIEVMFISNGGFAGWLNPCIHMPGLQWFSLTKGTSIPQPTDQANADIVADGYNLRTYWTVRNQTSAALQPWKRWQFRLTGAITAGQVFMQVRITRVPALGQSIVREDGGTYLTDFAAVTSLGTSAGILGQGWGATASENLASNARVPFGINRIVNSGFKAGPNGLLGWYGATAASNGHAVEKGNNLPGGGFSGDNNVLWAHIPADIAISDYADVWESSGAWNGGVGPQKVSTLRFGLKANPGDTIFWGAYVATHRCTAALYALCWDRTGAMIYAEPVSVGNMNGGAENGSVATMTLIERSMILPANVAFVTIMLRMQGLGAGDPYVFMTQPKLGKLAPGQTSIPAYVEGPGDPQSDVTLENTAGGIVGQGALATRNAADYGDGTLTNIPYPISPSQILQGTYLKAPLIKYGSDQTVESLKPGESGANVTEGRTSAAIAGQSSWATYGGLAPANVAGQVQYLQTDGAMQAQHVYDPGGSGNLYDNFPAQRGANVTGTNTAAAIAGQGTLATTDRVKLGTSGGMVDENNSYWLTTGTVVTSAGTASAILSQGAFATVSNISGSNVGSYFNFSAFQLNYSITRSDGISVVTEALSITSLGISAGIVGQGGLATANQVNTGTIAPNAATIPVSAYTAASLETGYYFSYGSTPTGNNNNFVTIQSASLTSSGAPILIHVSFTWRFTANNSSGAENCEVRLLRDGGIIWGPNGMAAGVTYNGLTTLTSGGGILSFTISDTPGTGAHSYQLQVRSYGGNTSWMAVSSRELALLETKR